MKIQRECDAQCLKFSNKMFNQKARHLPQVNGWQDFSVCHRRSSMPRLYIDLGYELSEQDLITYFSRFGRVSSVYLPRHDTGRSVGYAFATVHPVRPGIDSDKIAPGTVHTIRGYRISIHAACLDGFHHHAHRESMNKLKQPSRAHRQKSVTTRLPRSQPRCVRNTPTTNKSEKVLSSDQSFLDAKDALASFAVRW